MAIYYGSKKVAGGSSSGITELIQLVKDLSSKIDLNYDNTQGLITSLQSRIEIGKINDNILDYSLMRSFEITGKESFISSNSSPCDFLLVYKQASGTSLFSSLTPNVSVDEIPIPIECFGQNALSNSYTLTIPEKSSFRISPKLNSAANVHLIPYKAQRMNFWSEYTTTIDDIFGNNSILGDFIEPISAVYYNDISNPYKVTDFTTGGLDESSETKNLTYLLLILKAKKSLNIAISPYSGVYNGQIQGSYTDSKVNKYPWPYYIITPNKTLSFEGSKMYDSSLYHIDEGNYFIVRSKRHASAIDWAVKFGNMFYNIKCVPLDGIHVYNPS